MHSIFKDIFDKLFDNNPLAVEQSESPTESSKERKPGAVIKSFMYKKTPRKAYNSDDIKNIDKQLGKRSGKKDDVIEINPLSKRFTDDKKGKNLSMDEYDGKYTVEINSTAVGFPIRYNKKTGEVWLRFKDKDGKPAGKWYHYVDMDEEQFKSFMKAASKGRYVTKIMKYKNHDPAYGPAPRK